MNKLQILVVEDDKSVRNLMSTTLKAHDYKYIVAETGEEAILQASTHNPDIALLDLGLPDMDGTEVLKAVRKWSILPIIVVSARTNERDKVEVLDLGADDYITKPFGTAELLARIRMALRHTRTAGANQNVAQNGKFIAGDLLIDYEKYRVYVEGVDAGLTQNEFKIVSLLGKYAGKVLTYDFIIREIWGPNTTGDNQILRVNMANIRRKIEKNPAEPKYIFTEVGVGYRMIEGD